MEKNRYEHAQADMLLQLVGMLKTNSHKISNNKSTQQDANLREERIAIIHDLEQLVENINKNIGVRVMQARNSNTPAMKLRELAEKCGIMTPENLRRVEQNIHKISAAKLAVIASVQEKPISYYFDDFLYYANASLTEEQRIMCLNLMDYFLKIEIPELQLILFDFIKQLSQIKNLEKRGIKIKSSKK